MKTIKKWWKGWVNRINDFWMPLRKVYIVWERRNKLTFVEEFSKSTKEAFSVQVPCHSPRYPLWSTIRNKCMFILLVQLIILYWSNFMFCMQNIHKLQIIVSKDIWKAWNPMVDLCMSFWNILHKCGIKRRDNLCLRTIYHTRSEHVNHYTTDAVASK